MFFKKIKAVIFISLAFSLMFGTSQAKAADCATFPSRIAIHHGFDWSVASQIQLMNALKFECDQDVSITDIAGVIETILTSANIIIDGVEPFTISEDDDVADANNVLNFLISTPDDKIGSNTVILPLILTNRPIEDFVNYASLKGEPKAGEELVLRFAVEAQIAAQFNARPYIAWKRDGAIIPDVNSARYKLTDADAGKTVTAELRLENAKGDVLSRANYDTVTTVAITKSPPVITGLQLNGKPEEGQVLTVAFELKAGQGYEGDPRSAISWFRDGAIIKDARLPRFALTKDDVDKIISVEVTPQITGESDAILLRGEVGTAKLDIPISAKPLPQGQKTASLSMDDIKVNTIKKPKEGASPSKGLTVKKVVEGVNEAIKQEAETTLDAPKVAEASVAPPPVKPANIIQSEGANAASVPENAPVAPTEKPNQLAVLEDKITLKDGLIVQPEPEKEIPRGPLIKNLPKDLNGDRAPINCFLLEEVKLENSTVLDNASRDALLSPFIEKCTTPALIGNVMEALNNYYIDEGFVTTRAYVAPQDLRDGSLDIVIVEGRIESLQFDNTTEITKVRVDLAFPVEPGDVLNINSLERGLDQMNTPASNKVTMNMIPGTKPGYSIIDLEEEKIGPETRIKVGLDNMGSQGTGEDRLTLGIDIDNIIGMNDTWSFSHIGSLDTNAIAINGKIPSGDWTFNTSYSYSDYLNYIDEATQLFGRSETMELKADRLVHKADGNEWSFKSSINKKTSKRTIGDVKLKSQRMSVGRIGFGFSRKSEAVFSGNVYLAKGLKFFGAESDGQNVAEGTPRNQFTKIQFDASYYRPVFKNIYLQSALAGQVSSMSLFGSEQISAGGKSSVRGFARNTIAGDSGFYIQNDFLFPMPEIITWGPLREYIAAIKPFAGIDFAYTSDRSTFKRNSIAGLGLGARFMKGNFSGDLGIGIPIHRKDGTRGNRVEKYVKILYEALEF